MILSAQTIRQLSRDHGLLEPCLERGVSNGLSFGLGPAGYDLSLDLGDEYITSFEGGLVKMLRPQEFFLVAAIEKFKMPANLVGRVCDKSTLARQGLSVFNTVIEPGWEGFLTLELVNHSKDTILLRQGMGIAQVLFEVLDAPTDSPYGGKYQYQEPGPQGARFEAASKS